MSAPDDSAAGLAGHLRAAIADLDGYIERRAAELAAPRIADAHAQAAAEASRLRAELARRADLVAEQRASASRAWRTGSTTCVSCTASGGTPGSPPGARTGSPRSRRTAGRCPRSRRSSPPATGPS
ncbi:MAG TPA: hypothetical protein VGM53_35080 [Streptosporangiaceae bacterium]